MHHQEVTPRGTTLVVGADSGIGKRLLTSLARAGQTVIGTTRRDASTPPTCCHLDLACDPATWQLPLHVDVAYLCAAVTALATCEAHPAQTALINVERTCLLAHMLVERGALVVFLSTNLVFDGQSPYRNAHDSVCPTTAYGWQKAEAERALLAFGESVAVVRLTKVLAPETPLLHMWGTELRHGRCITPFADMVMAPVPLAFVCATLQQIGQRQLSGIFQVSGAHDLSYVEAALIGARSLGANPALIRPSTAMASGQVKVAPPRHTTLDATRIGTTLGLVAPPVEATLAALFAAQSSVTYHVVPETRGRAS